MSHCRLYLAPPLHVGPVVVTGDDHHYLFRVRRLRPGSVVLLFDGVGHEAEAEVEQITGEKAILRIGEVSAATPSPLPRLMVLLALIKGDRMDWAIQKLVELGASEIVPVRAARSVVKLDQHRADSRRERHIAIARDAARQCRSPIAPEIAPLLDFTEAIEHTAGIPLKLLCWARLGGLSLPTALPEARPERIAVLIGPEGGFAPEEVDLAQESGFIPVGLGPQTLRSETAAVAAAAILGYVFGTPD